MKLFVILQNINDHLTSLQIKHKWVQNLDLGRGRAGLVHELGPRAWAMVGRVKHFQNLSTSRLGLGGWARIETIMGLWAEPKNRVKSHFWLVKRKKNRVGPGPIAGKKTCQKIRSIELISFRLAPPVVLTRFFLTFLAILD